MRIRPWQLVCECVLQLASNTAAAKIAIAIICLLPVCRCAGIRNEISGEDEVFASGSGLYPSRGAIQKVAGAGQAQQDPVNSNFQLFKLSPSGHDHSRRNPQGGSTGMVGAKCRYHFGNRLAGWTSRGTKFMICQ
jgi:hypothetical protein